MADTVFLSNPPLLIALAAILCLWIFSAKKRSGILSVISCLLLTAIMIVGVLNGADYEELVTILLAFTLPGVIVYGKRGEGKG